MKANIKLKSGSFFFVESLAISRAKFTEVELDQLSEVEAKELNRHAEADMFESNVDLVAELAIVLAPCKVPALPSTPSTPKEEPEPEPEPEPEGDEEVKTATVAKKAAPVRKAPAKAAVKA